MKSPLINDLHVANLHSDKLFAEAEVGRLRKEIRELTAENVSLTSEAHISTRDARQAQGKLDQFPDYVTALDDLAILKRDAKRKNAELYALQQAHVLTSNRCSDLIRESKGWKAAEASQAREVRSLTERLGTAMNKAAAASERLAHAMSSIAALGETARETQLILNATARNIAALEETVSWSEVRVPELEEQLASCEECLAVLDSGLAEEVARTGPKKGRPVGHRGADWLLEHWDDYNPDARRQAFHRHCVEIRDKLSSSGIANWLPSALAVVLDSMPAANGSWVDQLFSSRPFCKRKNDFVSDLRDLIQAEWGADLALFALIEVGLSQPMYQKLRNAFNKSMFTPVNSTSLDPRAGMYTPRPWYTCPVTSRVFNLPEPFPSLHETLQHMKSTLAPMGLELSSDGRISERSFLTTLRQTFQRDASVLKVFDVRRPAHPCFGIDHASISGARDFTQGGITMGACYKTGSLLSEQKHVTLCIGRHRDDGSGLAAMLGPKPGVVGIAKEFALLSDSGYLDVGGGCIPCEPVICLDFAAFRGITRKRGKCSAIFACKGLASLQSYPGHGGIPDLPSGDTVADFHAA